MPNYIVPEPDGKECTKEALRRIALKHKAQYGQLPYPDKVPVPKLTKRNPNQFDLLWANKWNLTRHFIISGGGAALSTFAATKDLTATGGAFVIGGIVGVARKGNDDLRRSAGKPDLLTAAKNRITRTGGGGMGIRTEVNEFKVKLVELISIFFDETADKDQVMDIASGAWSAFNEAKDLKGISNDDLYKAGADVGLDLAVIFGGKFIKYSDEGEIADAPE